ncbi:hypothetical protein [Labrenzia sp. VG12]|uniref:hypothetical protein n=1 Tax=Labrenzia sp. VG12 TaxID=2021862 RepID=UPI000B8C1956|nr:hypothetical protein [Labrenzia sp. VG12]ASP32829.1 hypothetical protein CHH27_05845 [Labrenzia sp. VG12]
MKTALAIAILMATTLPSLAHPGEHGELTSLSSGLAHIAGSPFHVVLLLAVIAGGLAAWRYFKKREQSPSDRAS